MDAGKSTDRKVLGRMPAGLPDPRGSRCILLDPGDCLSGGQFEESYSVFRDFQNSEEQRNLERPA